MDLIDIWEDTTHLLNLDYDSRLCYDKTRDLNYLDNNEEDLYDYNRQY
jgi:hypothetical protein